MADADAVGGRCGLLAGPLAQAMEHSAAVPERLALTGGGAAAIRG